MKNISLSELKNLDAPASLDDSASFNAQASSLIGGNTLRQVKSNYSAAIQIQKPRNLNKVILSCEAEAGYAGLEFYYAWMQGSSIVEGLSVNAALAIARNWGNCAMDVKVEETPTSYIFNAAFIDLETGFNLVRPFRQNKQSPKTKKGTDIYKGDRGKDVIFQIGASKATRNVILNAIPSWLSSKVLNKAKSSVKAKIEKMGVPAATSKILKKIKSLNIPLWQIESTYGKQNTWDVNKLALLMGTLKAIENESDLDATASMVDSFSSFIENANLDASASINVTENENY